MKAGVGFDLRIRALDEEGERISVDFPAWPELHVTHVLTGSLEQSRGIGKMCAQEEAHVDVRREHIDVTECRVAYARSRMPVVEKVSYVVAAVAHAFVPGSRNLASRSTAVGKRSS
jgi:hypothetical protein